MAASTTVTNNNPFVRRTAQALINLQATPMSPDGPGAVQHFSDPQKSAGHVISSNTRDLFPSWPSYGVAKVKKADGTPVINLLKLRCRTFDSVTGGDTNFRDEATWAADIANGIIPTFVYDPIAWTSGDGKVYSSVTIIVNQYLPEDLDADGILDDAWTILTNVWQMNALGNLQLVSSVVAYSQPAPVTTGDAFLGNGTTYSFQDFTDYSIYATYSGEVDYGEMQDSYSETEDDYSEGGQVFRSCRWNSQSPHGLKDYVVTDSQYVFAKNLDGTPGKNGLFTYILADTEVPITQTQKVLVRGRWYFTPSGCGTCAFAGKTVTVEAKFKKALVTRVAESGSPFSVSIGTWSDHSTHTFTLTLPDSLVAQELGSDYDFPTQAGFVVALDDIKVTGIA